MPVFSLGRKPVTLENGEMLKCVKGDVSVKPYPSETGVPISFLMASAISLGRGAAAQTGITFILPTLACTIRINWVGTVGIMKGRYLLMVSTRASVSLGSGIKI